MVSDVQKVVRLQDLDGRIRELQLEIASLPKHIGAIEKTLDGHIRRVDADRAALAANQRERKRLEGEIQAAEQKISKLKGQMLDAKTNEQYGAFRKEIEFCEAEIKKHEDKILEHMTESEPLEKNANAAESALKQEKQHVESEKNAARDTTAKHKSELDALKKQRTELAASIPAPLYKAYERIRKSRKGVAIAEAVDGSCNACHMTLRLQFFQDLRLSKNVMFCESCGRIIYYNPPVETDENGGGPEASDEAHALQSRL